MWKTALKLVAQLLIAKFLRKHMQDAENNMTNNAQSHFSAVKQSMAALDWVILTNHPMTAAAAG